VKVQRTIAKSTVPTPQRKVAEQAVTRPGWRQMFSALNQSDFRALWLGMLPSMFALQMGAVTIGYVAYDVTGAATALGFIAAGSGIPMLVLALVGGVVADRVQKRNIIFTTQTTVGISVLIVGVLLITGWIQIWHLFVLAIVQGTSFAFNMPARQAFLAEVVPQERLMNAIALNNAGMSLSRIAGPAVAGALIGVAFIGSAGVFFLMALMYATAVVALFWVRPGQVRLSRHSGFELLRDGLRYVRRNPVLRLLLFLGLAQSVLGMPYVQIMPVFAVDVFDVGAGGLGLLMALNGAGALVGSLVIASMGNVRRRGLLQLALGVSFGLGLAMFSFSPTFLVAAVAIIIVGAAGSGYMTLNNTLIIMNCEKEYHGRVMSLQMMAFSAMPLGTVPVAWVVDQVGAPATMGALGIALALVVASLGFFSGHYRQL
jgi:MFS family permease